MPDYSEHVTAALVELEAVRLEKAAYTEFTVVGQIRPMDRQRVNELWRRFFKLWYNRRRLEAGLGLRGHD